LYSLQAAHSQREAELKEQFKSYLDGGEELYSLQLLKFILKDAEMPINERIYLGMLIGRLDRLSFLNACDIEELVSK
jgi:hypothetical protein